LSYKKIWHTQANFLTRNLSFRADYFRICFHKTAQKLLQQKK